MFNNVLKRFGCRYYVNFPTRVMEAASTAIDNFISIFYIVEYFIVGAEGIITYLSDQAF